MSSVCSVLYYDGVFRVDGARGASCVFVNIASQWFNCGNSGNIVWQLYVQSVRDEVLSGFLNTYKSKTFIKLLYFNGHFTIMVCTTEAEDMFGVLQNGLAPRPPIPSAGQCL